MTTSAKHCLHKISLLFVLVLALVGGALIASTDRVGAPSASWARRARRERAAAVRAAREGALEQAAAARGDAL